MWASVTMEFYDSIKIATMTLAMNYELLRMKEFYDYSLKGKVVEKSSSCDEKSSKS